LSPVAGEDGNPRAFGLHSIEESVRAGGGGEIRTFLRKEWCGIP
jgi:hypothetical protein